MSGSGGGSFGGQFGQDDFEVTCEKLTIDTQLSSPDPHVVAQLSIGVIMGIMQINSNGTLLTVCRLGVSLLPTSSASVTV